MGANDTLTPQPFERVDRLKGLCAILMGVKA